MSDSSKIQIPVLTGPGAFFIALIIIALWITSTDTRNTYLVGNPPLIVALVALSIPFSVFFVQIFYGLYTIVGYRKNYGKEFSGFSKFELDCFIDYLSHRKREVSNTHEDNFEKEWDIIYRKAQGRNLFGALFLECLFFLLVYSGFLLVQWNEKMEKIWIVLFLLIVIALLGIFGYTAWKLSRVIEMYDREIIENFKPELLEWAKKEL